MFLAIYQRHWSIFRVLTFSLLFFVCDILFIYFIMYPLCSSFPIPWAVFLILYQRCWAIYKTFIFFLFILLFYLFIYYFWPLCSSIPVPETVFLIIYQRHWAIYRTFIFSFYLLFIYFSFYPYIPVYPPPSLIPLSHLNFTGVGSFTEPACLIFHLLFTFHTLLFFLLVFQYIFVPLSLNLLC